MSRVAWVLLLALAGCSPAQYVAQPANVEETRDTVRALKAQQDELVKKIAAMENDLAAATGRLAENTANLNVELATLSEALERINDRLNDLSDQMQRRASRNVPPPPLEPVPAPAPFDTAAAPVPGSAATGELPAADVPPGGAGTVPSIDPEEMYDAAYRDVSRGSYGLAISGFQEFLRLFPEHELADNAQYWIGECYYVQNDAAKAREEFLAVLSAYPQGDKVPAAYLKLGYTALKLNNTNEARRYFDELIQKHPRSEEARSARQKLASLP